MFEARVIDLILQRLFLENKLARYYLMSGMGQEAAGAALGTLLRKDDYLFPPFRGYSYLLGKGVKSETLIKSVLMKRGGAAHGLIDDYCYVDGSLGIPGQSKILGANFSLAVGLGLAARRAGTDHVILCAFGDGEASRNTFAGALNLSKLWRLPILWVCENNRVSSFTPFEKISATPSISIRANAYDLPSSTFSGMEATALHEHAASIIERVRQESLPYLLELEVVRPLPHSYIDMYRGTPKFEFPPRLPKDKDPVAITSATLVKRGHTSSELAALREECTERVRREFQEMAGEASIDETTFWEFYQP